MNATTLHNRRPPHRLRHLASLLVLSIGIAGLTGCAKPELEQTLFQDSTSGSGLEGYHGITHGAAWGDVDNDGLPDLYVTNHLNRAMLFRNLGNGRFADISQDYFTAADLGGDKHGAAWADYDNDGDQDLVQLTGAGRGEGAEAKHLFNNLGTRFEQVAESVGVDNPYGRTRMPLWIDINRDGRLDLFQGAEERFDKQEPPYFFLQQADGKFTASAAVPFASKSPSYCVTSALNGDAVSHLLCRVQGKHTTSQVFDLSSQPARDLGLLPKTSFEDIAVADFNNDGKLDVFLARKNAAGPIAFGQVTETGLIADIRHDKGNVMQEIGFNFRSPGKVTVQVDSAWPRSALTGQQIYLGAGARPAGNMTFVLDPKQASLKGLPAHQPGKQAGVYIGYSGKEHWEVRVTAPQSALPADKNKNQQITLKLHSDAGINNLTSVGMETVEEAAPSRLFINSGGKLSEEADKRGLNERVVAGINTVVGDFDNDMDMDIFVLASGEIGMQDNLLLLNRGDGQFDVVAKAGGANGKRIGVGDSVTTADVDGDGFLDLLLSTGGSMGRSLGLHSQLGGYTLYRNTKNRHHWLKIDLEGRQSNRDGIGAVVQLNAGGKTQLRVQDGGVHERGQNHARLHFGLAQHVKIDSVTVRWPSGKTQQLKNIQADQILRIKEPG